MTRTTSRRARSKTIATRLGTVAAATAFLAGITAGTASAAGMSWTGDFSSRGTEVKRLANCAATAWFNKSKVGDEITDCNSAGSNSYWDGFHLAEANEHKIEGKRVGYRSDQSCPPKDGFQYVKCFYVGGKAKGNPVMTVAVESYGYGGMDTNVTWYYL
ncbi:hypothetical protein AB0I77_28355 [Streptomyces sp. NPDC050619]|uniref:hypothetical protein n=1 Tax=Streptomyces sp. NPDC050619 TaxID=3157214 RepID=UPI003421743B